MKLPVDLTEPQIVVLHVRQVALTLSPFRQTTAKYLPSSNFGKLFKFGEAGAAAFTVEVMAFVDEVGVAAKIRCNNFTD